MKKNSALLTLFFAAFALLGLKPLNAAFLHVDSVSCATLALTISSSPADSGCNGSAMAGMSGGTAPYAYSWSNGSVAVSLSNLCAGNYFLTVTDANGCSLVGSKFIDSAFFNYCSSFRLSLTHTNAVLGCNGTISAALSGGTTPYQYSWSDTAASLPSVGRLCKGSYSVQVKDARGCTQSAVVLIDTTAVGNPCNLMVANPVVSTCPGINAALSASGTTSYKWSPSTGLSSDSTAGTFVNVSASTIYTVTGSSTGCTPVSKTVTVQVAPMTLSSTVFNERCFGSSAGGFGIRPSGGAAPYLYTWSSSADTGSFAFSFAAGTYTVTVMDANGCSATTSATITQPPAINFVINSVSGPSNKCQGSITVSNSGGNPPYLYSWSNGSSSPAVNNLCPNIYVVTVTDANGCTADSIIQVNDAANSNRCLGFNVVISGPLSVISSCDGNLSAVVSGGIAPYTYNWSNYFNSSSISNLCPAIYQVQVWDSIGCYQSASFRVLGDSIGSTFPLNVFINSTDVSAPGLCNGSAVVSVSGGAVPYSILYSNGVTAATADTLCAGFYWVKITDSHGHKDSTSFIITSPNAIFTDTTGKSGRSLRDSAVVATLPGNPMEDCSINFSQVDSVTISSCVTFSTDSIRVTWNVYIGAVPTQVVNTYQVGSSGVYALTLQLYCNNASLKVVAGTNGFVKASGRVYIPIAPAGIAKTTVPSIRVFPTPFTDRITVAPATTTLQLVSLYDVYGKTMLRTFEFSGQSTYQLDLSSLSPGYYLMKFESKGNGQPEMVKIIKGY